MTVEHVVVVGAGLGGVRVVEQLRNLGHTGRITLVGAEEHPPYDRPPLSKQILTGAWELEKAVLRDKPGLDELNVEHRLGVAATGLRGTTVELADGTSVTGDAVVLATGVIARKLPGQPDGVATLRNLDDALALRGRLASARSLLIVGAGFIGAEVAHAARERGVEVTVLEALPAPCERALGMEVGAVAARLFTDAGVDLRCGARIARFVDEHTAELAGGSTVTADLVLVGIGSLPDVGWLAGSGLDTVNGIACDANGRARGVEGVWALGDVSAWAGPDGHPHRSEHWTNTVDQAAVVARDILGQEPPPPAVPYVWSDQFGLKVQVFGRGDLADQDPAIGVLPLHGEGLTGGAIKGTVIGYLADGKLIGVVGFGAARLLVRYRALVAAGADRAAALALADQLTSK